MRNLHILRILVFFFSIFSSSFFFISFCFYVNIFIKHVIKNYFEVEFILSYDFIILKN